MNSYPHNSLYAAVHAAEFPAQAILRLRPDLRSNSVVVLDGSPPQERVCAFNHHARKRGVVPGMTRLEVEDLDGIRILARSQQTEDAARMVLLECISQFSPRIEEALAPNSSSFVLDISGTERLFGPPAKLAQTIRNAVVSAGFRASVSVSANFDAARMKAESTRGITIIPSGKEACAIADISIFSLRLDEGHYETFAVWGIRTLGELAELPEKQLVVRMGQQSTCWLHLARGTAQHIFQPIEDDFQLREHIEFETHIEQIDPLLFIGSNMINNLVSRASSRALSLSSLHIQMSLDESRSYERIVRPAIPSNDPRFLLKLLQLEIASHPPQAGVASLTLTAEAGHPSRVQLGLFSPQLPEPSCLDVTLARLKAIVGEDRVGQPRITDTHCSRSFVMDNFVLNNLTSALEVSTSIQASLKRMRPPHLLVMQIGDNKPASFRDGAERYEVQVAYGPWRSSGSWWSIDKWDIEEWDVMATNNSGDPISCLLVYDHSNNKWLLDAFYD
jgi:protein ImuB